MDQDAKRFARRILLIHLVLLIVVLATVAGAARSIYARAREQMIEQAEERQRLLARQTATGIEGHYQSILNDLDLLHRAENDPTDEIPAADRPTASIIAKATDRAVASRSPIIGQVMWKQLDGRVSLLFSLDHTANARLMIDARRNPPAGNQNGRTDAQARPDLQSHTDGQGHSDARGDPSGRGNLPPNSDLSPRSGQPNHADPQPRGGPRQDQFGHADGPQNDTAQARSATPMPIDVHVIGTNDTRVNVLEVLHRSRQWIDQLTEASFSPFDTYNGVGVNLICIPMARGRDLVAAVPIRGIEKQFLKSLNDDPANGAWLIDEAGTAMAASRPELVGTTATNISDPQLRHLVELCIHDHAPGKEVMLQPFKIGCATFEPAMITGRPVVVGNKQWELFVTTSLDDVDGLVSKLMHRALIWCVFVVLSITAILVSTAVQMIRSRLRMERLQHEALTRELAQARQIQLAWLPDPHPLSESIDIAAVNSPASHISGDFYNWFELPDGRMVVTVGDVTGHGMAAAFLMATTQLLVRNTMVRLGDPARCLEEVNRQLCVQVFNGQFVTMVVMILDLVGGKLQIATAGHPAPLLADGESFQPIPLEPQLVLGVDRDTRYVTEIHDLPPQASLLLYTDGVVECPNAEYARFGDERLRRSLYGYYESSQEMLTRVVAAVDTFRGRKVLDDDLTLVAVQLQVSKASVEDRAAVAV